MSQPLGIAWQPSRPHGGTTSTRGGSGPWILNIVNARIRLTVLRTYSAKLCGSCWCINVSRRGPRRAVTRPTRGGEGKAFDTFVRRARLGLGVGGVSTRRPCAHHHIDRKDDKKPGQWFRRRLAVPTAATTLRGTGNGSVSGFLASGSTKQPIAGGFPVPCRPCDRLTPEVSAVRLAYLTGGHAAAEWKGCPEVRSSMEGADLRR